MVVPLQPQQPMQVSSATSAVTSPFGVASVDAFGGAGGAFDATASLPPSSYHMAAGMEALSPLEASYLNSTGGPPAVTGAAAYRTTPDPQPLRAGKAQSPMVPDGSSSTASGLPKLGVTMPSATVMPQLGAGVNCASRLEPRDLVRGGLCSGTMGLGGRVSQCDGRLAPDESGGRRMIKFRDTSWKRRGILPRRAAVTG